MGWGKGMLGMMRQLAGEMFDAQVEDSMVELVEVWGELWIILALRTIQFTDS